MNSRQFYINGEWVEPLGTDMIPVVNPATGQTIASVPDAGAADVNAAVAAASRAFPSWSESSVESRISILENIHAGLVRRNDELAAAITLEMGAPGGLSRDVQAPSGAQHFGEILDILKTYEFTSTTRRGTLIRQEPVGVCALISPWNWPMNQVATKVAPALAAGCTMVLKPSEISPLSALVLADILHEAGVPAGVFNLIQGTGARMGKDLTAHPDVDMISFTGSTRAGVAISQAAAPTVKRVSLELGGKSAGILAGNFDSDTVVQQIIDASMLNSGQSCNALTRVLVPESRYAELADTLAAAVDAIRVGDPGDDVYMGPVSGQAQYDKVQHYIGQGGKEGATLLAGGPGRPAHLGQGYFVRPTVFGDVSPEMTIAREEIFGPVLVLMRYRDQDEAIRIANDTPYGLSGYVWCDDHGEAVRIASRLRTGMVHINGAGLDSGAPFGGYRQSGNGREWGEYGLHEYLELKSIYGGADR